VPYIAYLIIYSLSRLPSSYAKQAMVEEPFTSQIQTVANVFYMVYAVKIVTPEMVIMVSFIGCMRVILFRARIMSINHHFHVAITRDRAHI
jgi:hypothetical protein